MTDFRALCAELLQFGDQAGEIAGNEGLWPDCDPGPDWLLDRARAELAKPAPERPTAKELRPIFDDQSGYIGDEQVMWFGDFVAAARAVLTRWGHA
jgi:hypothetical protein